MRSALLLAILMAFTGCAGRLPADPSHAAGPFHQNVALGACDAVEGVAYVPVARAAAHVPPAFRIVEDEVGRARIIWGAVRCGADERVYLAIQVEAVSEHLRDANVSRMFFEPEHAARGDILAALPAISGPSIDAFSLTLGSADARANIRTSGWAHRAEAPVLAYGPFNDDVLFGGVFREWFAVEGGYGYLQARFADGGSTALAIGALRLDADEGSITHELLGPDVLVAGIALREVAYQDASIGFVPAT